MSSSGATAQTQNHPVLPSDSSPQPPATTHWLIPLLLVLVGICLWLNAAQVWPTKRQFEFGAVALVLCLIPPVNRFIRKIIVRLRAPSPRTRLVVSCVLGIVAIAYMYLTAVHQGRAFVMVYHDEFMFRLQSQMLARGRLWMPAHPLADFFEMFYVIGRPVDAPIYYPGTAILSVPSVWLGAAPWVTPLILSGIAVGLTYRIATELIDGSAGLLIALMVLATPEFRRIAIMNLSQPPALVMGLLIILLWLRWRRSPSFWTTLFIGLCIGGAVIVRPIDAICFATPVGIAMLIRLRTRFDRILHCGAILLLGIAPFIALQLVFDRGVTGHLLQTPVQFLLDREMPGLTYGLGATTVPAQRPQTTLVQKQVFYQRTIVPFLKGDAQGNRFSKWYGQNGRKFVPLALPLALLVIFAPLVALSRHRLALIAIAPVGLFLVLYPMYPSFLPHYIFTFIPPIVMCVVLGMLALAEQFRQRAAIVWATLATVTLAMLLGYLPELDHTVRDSPPYMTFSTAEAIEAKLRTLPPGRSIVLFPFSADRDDPDEEPVHDCDAAWPDDQTLIRAHDLGERNRELFQYYAKRQPDREVYWFDRDRNSIRDMGNVKDLAAQ